MREGGSIALVSVLTGSVLLAIAAFGSMGGQEDDCSECHSPGSAQGGYELEDPDIFVGAPSGISAGDAFQVLVVVTEPSGYDLASAACGIDLSGLPGSEALGDGTVVMERNGTSLRGVLRVKAGAEGGTVRITVTCTAHHDHYRSDHPDVAMLRFERDARIQIGPPEDGGEAPPNDSPMGALPVLFGVSSILWWRAWKRARRAP